DRRVEVEEVLRQHQVRDGTRRRGFPAPGRSPDGDPETPTRLGDAARAGPDAERADVARGRVDTGDGARLAARPPYGAVGCDPARAGARPGADGPLDLTRRIELPDGAVLADRDPEVAVLDDAVGEHRVKVRLGDDPVGPRVDAHRVAGLRQRP